jgi:hypothetical protein
MHERVERESQNSHSIHILSELILLLRVNNSLAL